MMKFTDIIVHTNSNRKGQRTQLKISLRGIERSYMFHNMGDKLLLNLGAISVLIFISQVKLQFCHGNFCCSAKMASWDPFLESHS